MFNPSRDEVRQFFCEAWAKSQSGSVLTPLETLAVDWMRQHPEYHADLADTNEALARDYSVEAGRSNPFLHLSMHLSIEEQVSIDQPIGIRDAFSQLVRRLGDRHAAMHEVMDCLGEMIWTSQRNGTPLDGQAYVEAVRKRAGHG
jgi:hypothetical protein